MQIKDTKKPLDLKKLEVLLLKESNYITDLFSKIPFPKKNDDENESGEENEDVPKKELPILQGVKKSRATSIAELQERLKSIHGKKKLTFREKMEKKGLKNKLKKKTKPEERSAKQKLIRTHKLNKSINKTENGIEVKTEVKSKPVYNSEGNMVFSKFDFSGIGKEKKQKKKLKDPKKILENLQMQKEKLAKLEEAGEKEKVVKLKEKTAWKNALDKAEGIKVKDDPILLKKSVLKNEQRKKQSQKKWDKRIENVEKAKDEKQRKRTENLEKRKKDKKVKKLKKASKKGRIIPGF